MYKHILRTLFVFSLSALGCTALYYRSLFSHDVVEPAGALSYMSYVYDLEESEGDGHRLSQIYRWNFLESPQHTLSVGDLNPSAFDALESAEWTIVLSAEDGKMEFRANHPRLTLKSDYDRMTAHYGVNPVTSYRMRMPDGSYQLQRVYDVFCDLTVQSPGIANERKTRMTQRWLLDARSGYVDLIRPVLKLEEGQQARLIEAGADGQMNARFGVTASEQMARRLFYALVSIDSEVKAQRIAPIITQMSAELLEFYADKSQPWPACWGKDEALMRELNTALTPTLLYLEEKKGFGCKPLIDWINAEEFGRIFGDKFE